MCVCLVCVCVCVPSSSVGVPSVCVCLVCVCVCVCVCSRDRPLCRICMLAKGPYAGFCIYAGFFQSCISPPKIRLNIFSDFWAIFQKMVKTLSFMFPLR